MPAGSAANADSYGPVVLRHKTEFLGGAAAYLGDAVNGFFDNGGDYCYVVAIKADPSNGAAAAARADRGAATHDRAGRRRSRRRCRTRTRCSMPSGAVDEPLVLDVQRAVIEHCTRRRHARRAARRVRGKTSAGADRHAGEAARRSGDRAGQRRALPPVGPHDRDPIARFVPPCGQVAGIIARTDARDGRLQGAGERGDPGRHRPRGRSRSGFARRADRQRRQLPSRLSRTRHSRLGRAHAEPRSGLAYLNVRRLVLTVLRWIELNMTWATFEPNVPALWARIERELSTYLTGLWRAGALQGDAATDAFYVRCDAEINPAGHARSRPGRDRDRLGAERAGGVHRRDRAASRRHHRAHLTSNSFSFKEN